MAHSKHHSFLFPPSQSLLSKIDSTKTSILTLPERERKTSMNAQKSYQVEKARREEVLLKEIEEKEKLKEKSQSLKKALSNSLPSLLSNQASVETSNGSKKFGTGESGKVRRSSSSSSGGESGKNSSGRNSNSSSKSKGSKTFSSSGSSSSENSSPPRSKALSSDKISRTSNSESSANSASSISRSKSKEISSETHSSFTETRDRLTNFVKNGNEKSISPQPSSSSSSSVSKKSSTPISTQHPIIKLFKDLLSLKLLGLNLSPQLSGLIGGVLMVLLVWKRATSARNGGGGASGRVNEGETARKVRENLVKNGNEGVLMGGVRRVWDTLRM